MTELLVGRRRTIIDRGAIADRLDALPDTPRLTIDATAILRTALDAGRDEIASRVAATPNRGRAHAAAYAFLADQIVRLAFDFVTARTFPNSNPTASERIALVALGGTGRGEMAPFSDLDLMMLIPAGRAPWCEQVVEALLYILWDLKLKVGQSVRTPAETIALAKSDMTIRTSLLEARFLWGDQQLSDETAARFRREVVTGTAREFVGAKLAERDERHKRMGDSRYVVEPNVKDGKGGLRDLHTLYWIGKYVHGVNQPADLVGAGLLSNEEYRRFERAERFFWSVRCHLHLAAGRAEERLGFDRQREIAAAMRYADRPGKSAVERFMQFYFLNAKTVGDLTGVFLAQLDEQLARRGRRFALPALRLRRSPALDGFKVDRGRLTIPSDDFFAEDPVRLVDLFALAARERLEIHPSAMRAAARDARLVDAVRDDPRANASFLAVLTDRNAPELALRWMNEAGVFGRFVPDFGRVVAQMQFDMYHHYTVDEHTIRAIGLLAAIERGELAQDHPLATVLFNQIASRRALYVAVLLHDIAKGRGGNHSELGADIAVRLCPRFGLDAGETETVAWLVRHHLLLSNTAFRRDLADPTTIEDVVHTVQSPERLRLLLLLTIVDIRAVGPGTWTEWKSSLLRSLFEAAEERLRLGHKQRGRSEEVSHRKQELGRLLGPLAGEAEEQTRELPDSYWLAEPIEWQLSNVRQMVAVAASGSERRISVVAEDDPPSAATRVTVFAPDAPGLFYRVSAALAAAGASIFDARIHTTQQGMVIDNLLVHDRQGRAYSDKRLLARLVDSVIEALHGDLPVALPLSPNGQDTFRIAPRVLIAEQASRRTTVVEVNAADRPALLARLAGVIHECGLIIHSAHIATYGERAVDVFYLTDGDGLKLKTQQSGALQTRLLEAAGDLAAPSRRRG